MALHTSSIRPVCLNLESLEKRVLLSHVVAHAEEHGGEHDAHEHGVETATCEFAKSANLAASAYRLDLVVLHELGHSLGLGHSNDRNSIMYAYYNANYNINNFNSDSIVPTLQSRYANINTSPWKDSLDASPGNGRIELTYSYVPDGSRAEQNKATSLFSTLDGLMSRNTWQGIFSAELNRWANASNNKISFSQHSDSGATFNFSGSVQNDSRAGDLRFGAHRMDGANKTLAHTYLPPPNNSGTAAGDLHLDFAEGWTAGVGTAPAPEQPRTPANTRFSQGSIVDFALDAKQMFDIDRDVLQPVLV